MSSYLLWFIFGEWGGKGSPGLLLGGDIGLGRVIVWGVGVLIKLAVSSSPAIFILCGLFTYLLEYLLLLAIY